MNAFDRQFQTGSPFLIALFSLATLFFVGVGMLWPEDKYFALLVVMLGLSGVWKHVRAYQRKKAGSFELLGERRDG